MNRTGDILSGKTIAPLTALRFFAAALVVQHHLQSNGLAPPTVSGPFLLFDGVSFFFILSGFVLQHAYRDRIKYITWWEFYRLRIARIWPLHLATFSLGLTATSLAISQIPVLFVGAFLLQSWVPDPKIFFVVNGVAWSLSCELFFYAVFPYLSRVTQSKPTVLVSVTCACLAVYLIPGSWYFIPGIDDARLTGLFAVSPLVRLPEFIAGILLYEAYLRIKSWEISSWGWTAAEIFSVMFICALNYAIAKSLPMLVVKSAPIGVWLMNAGTAPAFMFCILVFSLSRGLLVRFLSNRIFVYLGEISFSVYLIHQLVIRFVVSHPYYFGPLSHAAVAIIATLALSIASHHLFEQPIIGYVKRMGSSAVKKKLMPPEEIRQVTPSIT